MTRAPLPFAAVAAFRAPVIADLRGYAAQVSGVGSSSSPPPVVRPRRRR
ncbi:hypothetical protein [Saccharomonospora marina]|nr:hypothetical protein [Saccharomonospora marina]